MSFLYLLDFLAPLGIVALLISAIVGLIIKFGEHNLKKFAPVAQFRLVFTAAILPLLISLIFLIGASAGWKLYGETELCLMREKSGHLSNFLLLFSAISTTILLIRVKNLSKIIWKEYQFKKMLDKNAVRQIGNFLIIPFDKPQAFVLGLINPKIYLSRGLLKKFDRTALKTIIAHEKAHVVRRDPLRRLLALIALVFHLPVAAAEINRQLALIQELIADNAAAEKSGSRLNLAELLVGFARTNLAGNISAFEFGNSNIEVRVRRLLDSDNNAAKISLTTFAIAGAGVFFGVLLISQKLHLLYELILSIY